MTPVSSRSVVRQTPAVGQARARGGRLVAQDERDAGVAQGVEAGADRQPGGAVEGREAIRRQRRSRAARSSSPARAASLITSPGAGDRLEARPAAVVALDQAGDVLRPAWPGAGAAGWRRCAGRRAGCRRDCVVEDALSAGQAREPAPVTTTGTGSVPSASESALDRTRSPSWQPATVARTTGAASSLARPRRSAGRPRGRTARG